MEASTIQIYCNRRPEDQITRTAVAAAVPQPHLQSLINGIRTVDCRPAVVTSSREKKTRTENLADEKQGKKKSPTEYRKTRHSSALTGRHQPGNSVFISQTFNYHKMTTLCLLFFRSTRYARRHCSSSGGLPVGGTRPGVSEVLFFDEVQGFRVAYIASLPSFGTSGRIARTTCVISALARARVARMGQAPSHDGVR